MGATTSGGTPNVGPALADGRYVLLARLGEGSQGETWDAVDKREGRKVAIKRFDVRGARAWKDVELAEREARVLSQLAHPKLPRYVAHFEEAGALYLVMEKIEGTPLSEIRKRGPLAESEVLRLLRDGDEVLAYLHGRAQPVIHRDIKPSNVIRRDDGSFAFVDFGAVRERMRPEGGSTVVGTFGYMAPEQFQGRAGPGSDVYALGATALALLTGEEPEKLPHRGLAIDVDAALAGTRTSRELRAALARMLEPDPDRRPTRVAEVLRDARTPPPPSYDARRGRADFDGREPSKRARKHQERAERRARRAERRAQRMRENGPPPPIAMFFVVLALTIAQVAVILALRVAVPIVLTLLSLVFGPKLRAAASSVAAAGTRASEAIARRRAREAEDIAPEPHIGVRVVGADEARARVAVDDDVDDERADDDEQTLETSGKSRRAT